MALNSTFEEEDEVFNAIIKSKMSHIKHKHPRAAKNNIPFPVKNIHDKNMKTITDKESEGENVEEEAKINRGNIMIQNQGEEDER